MDLSALSMPHGNRFAAPLRLATLAVAALALTGCASVSIPFGDSLGIGNAPAHTASTTAAPTEDEMASAEALPLPDEISAVAPVAAQTAGDAEDRPVEALIAAMPEPQPDQVRLTQSDLNAMGAALSYTLDQDPDVGTFAWSHEATGRSGVMTPFRTLSSSGDSRCRVVSVEITDGGRDTILLADACQEDDRWVFVTPRAGQVL